MDTLAKESIFLCAHYVVSYTSQKILTIMSCKILCHLYYVCDTQCCDLIVRGSYLLSQGDHNMLCLVANKLFFVPCSSLKGQMFI